MSHDRTPSPTSPGSTTTAAASAAVDDGAAARTVGRRMGSDERREQLLAVGRQLFSERAYDEVAVHDIAEAAGVARGLLYHYFGNKRGLYLEALHSLAAELVDILVPDGDLDPLTNLVDGLRETLAWIRAHEIGYMAVVAGGMGTDPDVAAVVDRVRVAIADLVLANVEIEPAVRPLALAHIRGWLGYVEGLVPMMLAGTLGDDELVGLASVALFSWFGATDGIDVPAIAP